MIDIKHNRLHFRLIIVMVVLMFVSCEKSVDPFSTKPPPEGPHFSVSPIPTEYIARITPIGYNNKTFPTAHTYWHICDHAFVLQSSRPCVLERFDIRAPGSGTVKHVDHSEDGSIAIEGPPGLVWTFAHVTPAAGLKRGTSVTAGQIIAKMYYEHSFDFGLTNYGITHDYITPSRYPDPALHAQHPIDQYPEPMRSELLSRVQSLSGNPLGRLSYDVPGTASGAWFREGSPMDNTPLTAGQEWRLLWLGRYTEFDETRILHVGEAWDGMSQVINLVVDENYPSWEDINPATGRISLKLWFIDSNAQANKGYPTGTVLLEMTSNNRLKIEWFPTHDLVDEFTGAARIYER